MEHQPSEEGDEDGRHHRDDDTIDNPHVVRLHGGNECLPGTQSHSGKEEGNAHFAQHVDSLSFGEVGAVPAFLHAEPSGNKGHHQGAAGQAQLDGGFHAHRYGDGAQNDAQGNDDKNGDEQNAAFLGRTLVIRSILCGLSILKLFGGFFLEVDAAEPAQQQAGDNHAYHSQGIGYGIARSQAVGSTFHAQVAHSLLCSRETRCVGDGTGIDTRHIGEFLRGKFGNHHGDAHAQSHIDQSHEVHGQAAFLKRTEETRSHLQAYSGDKENETELLNDMEHFVVASDSDGTQTDAHKEYPGDAQRDALDLDFAKQQTGKDGDGQHQHSRTDAAVGK